MAAKAQNVTLQSILLSTRRGRDEQVVPSAPVLDNNASARTSRRSASISSEPARRWKTQMIHRAYTPRCAVPPAPRRPARYSTPARIKRWRCIGSPRPRTLLQTKDALCDRGTRRAHRVHGPARTARKDTPCAHTRPGSLPDARFIPLRVSVAALIRAA
ncbi:hypothetical protein DFH09DRAFT_1333206 [Mycena vulgaris]|nr:hypothetical protein DFH09DRAFT_1333206 [Mycena vulgaris]